MALNVITTVFVTFNSEDPVHKCIKMYLTIKYKVSENTYCYAEYGKNCMASSQKVYKYCTFHKYTTNKMRLCRLFKYV